MISGVQIRYFKEDMEGKGQMEAKPHWRELVERAKNFHGNYEQFLSLVAEHELFFIRLQGVNEHILIDIDIMHELSSAQMLKMVFLRMYDFVVESNDDFSIFGRDSCFEDEMFDACLFSSLCLFLHDTKKSRPCR